MCVRCKIYAGDIVVVGCQLFRVASVYIVCEIYRPVVSFIYVFFVLEELFIDARGCCCNNNNNVDVASRSIKLIYECALAVLINVTIFFCLPRGENKNRPTSESQKSDARSRKRINFRCVQ